MSREAFKPEQTIREHIKHLVVELLRHHPEAFDVMGEENKHITFEEEGFELTLAPEFVEWLREKVSKETA